MLIAAYIAEALSLLMLMMPMLVLLTVVCWQMHYRMPTGGADPDSCPATYTLCVTPNYAAIQFSKLCTCCQNHLKKITIFAIHTQKARGLVLPTLYIVETHSLYKVDAPP